MGLRKKIKKHISRLKMFLDQNSNFTYSQEGEDRILLRYFNNKRNGFYIDIGAHHPKRYSNTYLLYNLNWSGINIDAIPGSMNIFNKLRPRDINLEIAISDKSQMCKYYIFNEPALNTLSEDMAKLRSEIQGYKIIEIKEVQADTLPNIFDSYLAKDQKIDLLTIDIEGFDLIALKTIDFFKYTPKLILVEIYDKELFESEIYFFLISKGYIFIGKTVLTCFFKYNNLKE